MLRRSIRWQSLFLLISILQLLILPASSAAHSNNVPQSSSSPQYIDTSVKNLLPFNPNDTSFTDRTSFDRPPASNVAGAPIAPYLSSSYGAIEQRQHAIYLPLVQHGYPTTTSRLTRYGGQMTSLDGAVTLLAPAGAVSEDVYVTLTQGQNHPSVAANRDLGVFFALTARTADRRPVTHFAKTLGIRVRYNVDPHTSDIRRHLYYYSTERKAWLMLPSIDSAAAGLLTATTNHFTQFAVLADPASCDTAPGEGAAPAIRAKFAETYDNHGGVIWLGCPTNPVHIWGGTPAQDFEDGSAIVYNSSMSVAYYINSSYLHGYQIKGGPAGFLGLPIEHSNEAVLPPIYYKDYDSDYTSEPIQLFEKGFVGFSGIAGEWDGSRHYPLACDVSATIVPITVRPDPTEDNPNPAPITKKKLSFSVGGIPDPGDPYGSASFDSAILEVADVTAGFGWTTSMSRQGDRFIYEAPYLIEPTDQIEMRAEIHREGDDRAGFFPKTWIDDRINFKLPSGFGHFGLSSCKGARLPGGGDGGGGYIPPADTTPPVIGEVTPAQDGHGAVSIRAKITDDRAVAVSTVSIDGGPAQVMLPRGGDIYEGVVYNLGIGWHTFAINATDTSGNHAAPKTGRFKIERTDSYGNLEWQPTSPDPVNTLIGNYTYHYTDIKLPGPGPEFKLERFYNGQSTAQGLFGLGWTTLFDMRVTAMDNLLLSGAIMRYPDGHTANFPANGASFGHAPTVLDTLAREGGGYLLTRVDQTRYHFDDQGRLTKIEDTSGNAIILTYADDTLARIEASNGRRLTLTSNGDGRVTRIDAPGGVALTYVYDANGYLTDVTDGRGATVHYRYDADNGLTGLQTPQGHDFLKEQTFDTQGRVTFQRVGDNFINRFSYDDASRTTVISDTYGKTITYRYDDQGRIVEQIDALGSREAWTYNADNQRTSYTDRNGHTTYYQYNVQGDLIKITNSLNQVTLRDYDGQHHLLSETDALGRTTRYEYDSLGRRTAIVDALGGRTTMRYNGQGQVIEQVSPRGSRTTYVYDTRGNLIAEHNALGGVTHHEYDALGRRVKTIDANGHATTFTYDSNGNLLTQTDALGHTLTYAYDDNNNRVSETDANGHTTRYTYSRLDNLVTTTMPDGGVTTIVYDDLNHRIAQIDPLGHTIRWGLDATYRVISETDALDHTTRYGYDPQGNRTSVTDANGHTTRYVYDALNRVVAITDPLGGVTRYTYDAVGNRLSETDANSATTTSVYDALNRVIAQIDALGARTTYSYDADGHRVSTTDPNGYASRQTYDALSRITSETDPLGNTIHYKYDGVGNKTDVIDALGNTTVYIYNAVNRLVEQIDALGGHTRYEYDAVGNQTILTDALGNATRYAYDSVNRRILVTDALGGQEQTTYDLAGRRISLTDANGHTSRYEYDAVGRTIAVIDPLGFTTRSAYDPAGNLTSETDANGAVTRYAYDALNRRVAKTNALGFTTRFAYDAVGNVTSTIDANGHTTIYAYDLLKRKIAETNALGFTTRYEYDRMGRLIRTIFADGSATMRAYDADGRLVTETDAEGFSKLYRYDAVGSQVQVTDALGHATRYSYDALRRQIDVKDDLGVVKTTAFDAVGNIIAETDGNGHVTRYVYDALRRQTSATDAEGNITRYAYDPAGNRIALTDGNGHITRFVYDARNQLVSQTNPLGQIMRYGYDGDGHKVQVTDELGVVTANSYDAVGQLVAVMLNAKPGASADAQTNVATRYTYDPVGNRTTTTDPNGHTVTFTPDALGQLVAETDALGHTTRYTFDPLGRQVRRTDPNGTVVTSAYDRNGSLVRTGYPDGGVVTRTYDGDRNLLEMRDSTGATRRSYDARNRLISEETAQGRVVYAYDGANNRTAVDYPDGKTARYAYFANNQLQSVTNPDGAVTTYERDGVGQVLRQNNGNGTITAQQYDAADHLLLVETRQVGAGNKLIVRISYQYDAAGQRARATTDDRTGQPKTITESYAQDPLRRLIGVTSSDGVRTSYRYDATGNRITWASNDDPRTNKPFDALDLAYTYDAADELTRAEDRAAGLQTDYRYDANGNRSEQRSSQPGASLGYGTAYDYDAENRLAVVQQFQVNGADKINEHAIATMGYDGDGRRVRKSEDHQVGGGGVQTTNYLYDGLDPIATYETWHPQHDNLYRADGGRILTLDRNNGGSPGQTYWFAQDALGSTMALSQDQGQGAHHYRYEAFGSIIPETSGAFGPQNAFTFTGQEYDDFIGLYHFHARAYDPGTGTWLTRDPFRGSPDDPQSLHRYGYVKGNPVNLADVYGYVAMGGTYGKYDNDPYRLWREKLQRIEHLPDFRWQWEFNMPIEIPDKVFELLKFAPISADLNGVGFDFQWETKQDNRDNLYCVKIDAKYKITAPEISANIFKVVSIGRRPGLGDEEAHAVLCENGWLEGKLASSYTEAYSIGLGFNVKEALGLSLEGGLEVKVYNDDGDIGAYITLSGDVKASIPFVYKEFPLGERQWHPHKEIPELSINHYLN